VRIRPGAAFSRFNIGATLPRAEMFWAFSPPYNWFLDINNCKYCLYVIEKYVLSYPFTKYKPESLKGLNISAQGNSDVNREPPWVKDIPKPPGHGRILSKERLLYGRKDRISTKEPISIIYKFTIAAKQIRHKTLNPNYQQFCIPANKRCQVCQTLTSLPSIPAMVQYAFSERASVADFVSRTSNAIFSYLHTFSFADLRYDPIFIFHFLFGY
jgi:hypothetical protein